MGAYLTGEPLLPVGTYRDRRSFSVMVRKAIAEKRLASYERDHWMGRAAVLTDGTVLTYESAYQSQLEVQR